MQLTEEQEKALKNFKALYPFLMLAVKTAEIQYPGFKVKLGILAYHKDNSGQVVSSFEAIEFMKDLRVLTEFDKDFQLLQKRLEAKTEKPNEQT